MVLTIAFQFLVLWGSLTQSGTTTLRIGDVARQLTEPDVAALELVLPSGAKPWLLNGDPAQIPKAQVIQAFLSPTTTTPALCRGPLIWVKRGIAPPTAWSAQPAESYAQVMIPGRTFDQIEGDQDINRPFRVIGRFDDTELIRLVEFLRSNPPTRVGGSNAIRPWPILSIDRKADDSVEVCFGEPLCRGNL
jgi:hypothetical protein